MRFMVFFFRPELPLAEPRHDRGKDILHHWHHCCAAKRLERLATDARYFSGNTSPDGTNWTLVGSRSITMATNVYFGLVVASGTSNILSTATFADLIVVPVSTLSFQPRRFYEGYEYHRDRSFLFLLVVAAGRFGLGPHLVPERTQASSPLSQSASKHRTDSGTAALKQKNDILAAAVTEQDLDGQSDELERAVDSISDSALPAAINALAQRSGAGAAEESAPCPTLG